MFNTIAIATLAVLLFSSTAHAQETTLYGQVREFFGDTFTEAELEAAMQSLRADLGTFPIGSSSGAFTWTFDASLGTVTRETSTFGPWFAERAATMGRRGTYSLGLSYQRSAYRRMEDLDLRSGQIGGIANFVNLNRQDFIFPAGFERPLEVARVSMELTTNRLTAFGTAALTDKLDFSVVIPIQDISVKGSNTPADATHRTINASQTGFGDIVLRGKYQLARLQGLDLASQLEVRLPTGDEAELLGTGKTLTRVMLIASRSSGRMSPHINIGYLFAGGGAVTSDGGGVTEPPTPPTPGVPTQEIDPFPTVTESNVSNELDYTVGIDAAPHPKLTLVGDIIGRRVFNVAQFARRTVTRSVFIRDGAQRLRAYDLALDGMWAEAADVNVIYGGVGAKYNVWSNALINLNVLFPLTRTGFTPNLATVLGFEWAF